MNIISDPNRDASQSPDSPGGYEWWYFDALSADGNHGVVVIFYEGNPFSTRYNRALLSGGDPVPSNFPAISISVYEDGKPIYYSFTEFDKDDCSFSEEQLRLKVGPHRVKSTLTQGKLKYELELSETLPSGDRLEAALAFESSTAGQLWGGTSKNDNGHQWNLVQPRAAVQGTIRVTGSGENPQNIAFEGEGYHDHNTGQEPMRQEFREWYWGRIHFEHATLVYYVMDRQDEEQHQAWLIDQRNELLEVFDEIELIDEQFTLFGLKTARKITLRSAGAEVQIQQSHLLDNGPFYQRFKSDAFLRLADEQIMERQQGISEYIHPDRIFARLFWPFVDMRIRYASEKPHWVQRSKRLYRWTW